MKQKILITCCGLALAQSVDGQFVIPSPIAVSPAVITSGTPIIVDGSQGGYSGPTGTGVGYDGGGIYIGKGGQSTQNGQNLAIGTARASVGGNPLILNQIPLASLAPTSSGTSANYNLAIGRSALMSITTSIHNTAVGQYGIMANMTAGNYNTSFGASSLSSITTGNNNCAFGWGALSSLGSGNNNLGIGFQSQVPVSTGSNQLSIQNVIYGTNMNAGASGRIRIGSAPAATTGIGTITAAVTAKLRIDGIDNGNTNATTIPSLQLGHVPTYTGALPVVNPVGTGKYLFVDAAGVVSQAAVPAGQATMNVLASAGNTMTSTVNGVAANAPIVNTVTNNVVNNTLTTTVNGVASVAVPLTNLGYWSLTGNANTVPGTGAGQNYLGTTGNQRLVVATNATERMTILGNNGFVGIATANPVAPLEIRNPTNAVDNYLRITGIAPSIQFQDVNTPANIGRIGLASAINHFAGGSVAGDFIVQSLATGDLILGAGNITGNGYGVVRVEQQATAFPNNNPAFNANYRGSVGINLFDATGAPGIAATAHLHVNGTVRLQNLPINTQANLPVVVIDANGNLFRANTTVGNRPAPVLNTEVEDKLNKLEVENENIKLELADLKNKLNQLIPGEVKLKVNSIEVVPNPITGTSTVSYKLDNTATTSFLIVSDLQGRLIKQISLAKNVAAGQVQVSKSDLPKGMYVFAIVSGNTEVQSKKVLVSE